MVNTNVIFSWIASSSCDPLLLKTRPNSTNKAGFLTKKKKWISDVCWNTRLTPESVCCDITEGASLSLATNPPTVSSALWSSDKAWVLAGGRKQSAKPVISARFWRINNVRGIENGLNCKFEMFRMKKCCEPVANPLTSCRLFCSDPVPVQSAGAPTRAWEASGTTLGSKLRSLTSSAQCAPSWEVVAPEASSYYYSSNIKATSASSDCFLSPSRSLWTVPLIVVNSVVIVLLLVFGWRPWPRTLMHSHTHTKEYCHSEYCHSDFCLHLIGTEDLHPKRRFFFLCSPRTWGLCHRLSVSHQVTSDKATLRKPQYLYFKCFMVLSWLWVCLIVREKKPKHSSFTYLSIFIFTLALPGATNIICLFYFEINVWSFKKKKKNQLREMFVCCCCLKQPCQIKFSQYSLRMMKQIWRHYSHFIL